MADWPDYLGIDDRFLFADGTVLRTIGIVGSGTAAGRVVLYVRNVDIRNALLDGERRAVERARSGTNQLDWGRT